MTVHHHPFSSFFHSSSLGIILDEKGQEIRKIIERERGGEGMKIIITNIIASKRKGKKK
jgi:hypothetical protein